MKYFILLVLACIPLASYAEEKCTQEQGETVVTGQYEISTDVPAHLKGATITVRTADGRESTVPAERFKVVPRKQQFITKSTEKTAVLSCVNNAPRRNRVAVLGGHGAQEGLNVQRDATSASIESKVGAVGGAQYQYLTPLLDDRISVGGQAQTNKTFSLSVGLDF